MIQKAIEFRRKVLRRTNGYSDYKRIGNFDAKLGNCWNKVSDFLQEFSGSDARLVENFSKNFPQMAMVSRYFLDRIIFRDFGPKGIKKFTTEKIERLCVNKGGGQDLWISKKKGGAFDLKGKLDRLEQYRHASDAQKKSELASVKLQVKQETFVEPKNEIDRMLESYLRELNTGELERNDHLSRIDFNRSDQPPYAPPNDLGVKLEHEEAPQFLTPPMAPVPAPNPPLPTYTQFNSESKLDSLLQTSYLATLDRKKISEYSQITQDLEMLGNPTSLFNTFNKYDLNYGCLVPDLYETQWENPFTKDFVKPISSVIDFEKEFSGNCLICNKDKIDHFSIKKLRTRKVQEDGALFYCTLCKSGYHRSCYRNGDAFIKNDDEWVCELCQKFSTKGHFIQCGLCPWRGGSLRQSKFKILGLKSFVKINIQLEKYKQSEIPHRRGVGQLNIDFLKEANKFNSPDLSTPTPTPRVNFSLTQTQNAQTLKTETTPFADPYPKINSCNFYRVENKYIPGLLPDEPIPSYLMVH
jgi:hypothetical protein